MEKYDFNDISLVPERLSYIRSRSEIDITINGTLPIIVAPMDMVIDESNYELFLSNKINVALPRNVHGNSDCFYSFGVKGIKQLINDKLTYNKVLLDTANAHSIEVLETAKLYKDTFPDSELMVGNIANPYTYMDYANIGVDYIRIGIGGGSACTTSANASVHYPLASLISEIFILKEEHNYNCKIVADGGFKNTNDIIKALALGADYVMIGGIFNKCLESCSPFYDDKYNIISNTEALELYNLGHNIYKKYRGMSTKDVQKKWGNETIKTAEGISFYNKVEYTLSQWIENFEHYLKSTMSYCNSLNLQEFKDSNYIRITENSFKRYNK